MITDAILNILDSSIGYIIGLLPTLPKIELNVGVTNFLVNAFRVLNVFFDMQLVTTYLTIALSVFSFTLIMRLMYILRA